MHVGHLYTCGPDVALALIRLCLRLSPSCLDAGWDTHCPSSGEACVTHTDALVSGRLYVKLNPSLCLPTSHLGKPCPPAGGLQPHPPTL